MASSYAVAANVVSNLLVKTSGAVSHSSASPSLASVSRAAAG
jgi:hypothetical protein